MMGFNRNSFTFDAALALKAAGLVAATANGATILDLGDGLVDGHLVVDLISVGGQSCTVSLEASNVAAMDSGSVCLARKTFGDLVVPMDAALSAAGRYVISFRNEEAGKLYRYVRIHTTISNITVEGINYSAFIAKDD
jgi:hypothetical protein